HICFPVFDLQDIGASIDLDRLVLSKAVGSLQLSVHLNSHLAGAVTADDLMCKKRAESHAHNDHDQQLISFFQFYLHNSIPLFSLAPILTQQIFAINYMSCYNSNDKLINRGVL